MIRTPIALLALVVWPSVATSQSTWIVDPNAASPGSGTVSDPYSSIQFAIDQPETRSGDTLRLLPGRFQEQVEVGAKSLRLVASETRATVIDAEGLGPVVLAIGPVAVDLVGLVIEDGVGIPITDPASGLTAGGGLIAVESAVWVHDCEFRDGESAILARDARVRISETLISGHEQRAVVAASSSLKMSRSHVVDNGSLKIAFGGGVYLSDGTSASFDGCTITGNRTAGQSIADPVARGAGIYAADDVTEVLVDRCYFANNIANFSRGGAYCGPGHIQFSRIFDNGAFHGGGVYGSGERLLVEDSQISGNNSGLEEGGGDGGGAHSATLRRCLVEDNRGVRGEGGGAFACELSDCEVVRNRLFGRLSRGAGIAASTARSTRIAENEILGNPMFPDAPAGGGAFESSLDGCELVDNVLITFSTSAVGAGAVFGTLKDTLVARNLIEVRSAGGSSFGAGVFGVDAFGCTIRDNGSVLAPGATSTGGGASDSLLDHCVLFDNRAQMASAAFDSELVFASVAGHSSMPGSAAVVSSDGSHGIQSSILWGNRPASLAGDPPVRFSIVEGLGGLGTNLDADPLYFSMVSGDLHLMQGSPAIDTADPTVQPDADGSRADMGAFPFDREHCLTPGSFCTAKEDSGGCLPRISAVGEPSVSSPDDFFVRAENLQPGGPGFLLISSRPASRPMFGGTLCIDDSARRITRARATGGSGDCSGTLEVRFELDPLAGLGLGFGKRVYTQFLYRDAAGEVGLSDGLEFVICP